MELTDEIIEKFATLCNHCNRICLSTYEYDFRCISFG